MNADGHVVGAPHDAFFKSGAGGFGIYVIPSLDMVIYKMAGTTAQYDPSNTGLPLAYQPDTSRDGWNPSRTASSTTFRPVSTTACEECWRWSSPPS